MSIMNVSLDEVIGMKDSEGLVIQGCGGRPEDWLEGINDIFSEEDIFIGDSRFEDAFVFKYKTWTCILFPFKKVNIHPLKLATWRVCYANLFGGMWLSDFIDNNQDYSKEKPKCNLIGKNGNIFNLLCYATETLKEFNLEVKAKEMQARVMNCHSYDEALDIIDEYVDITGDDEEEE